MIVTSFLIVTGMVYAGTRALRVFEGGAHESNYQLQDNNEEPSSLSRIEIKRQGQMAAAHSRALESRDELVDLEGAARAASEHERAVARRLKVSLAGFALASAGILFFRR